MGSKFTIPKKRNSIVITYLPGDNITWVDPIKKKYPNINFVFYEINAETTPILARRGFNTVPAIQYWPQGYQSLSVQGNFDAEILERDIQDFKF